MTIIGLIVLVNTKPMVAHYYHLITDNHKVYEDNILYKGISSSKDIEGEYKINVKYSELYAVGLLIKKNNLGLKGDKYDWLKNPPLKLKIEISKNNEIIYSNTVNKFKLMSLDKHGNLRYEFVQIPLKKCKDCILKIKLINVNLLEYENTKDIVYLYMAPTGYI